MLTEKYTVGFFGVDSKYYTNEFIAYLWEQSANNEYKNSGIFVSASFEINKIVCGEIRGCELGETIHILRTVRNPAEVPDAEKFSESFNKVTNDVRQKLGNPYMTITKDSTEFFFFVQI